MTKPIVLGIRYGVWLLLPIILLGMALRFFHLGVQSLWYDEAVSLAIADRLSLWEILSNQGHSSHPPLYYLLLRAWIRQVGINDFTARVPSALAGVLTIPLIYQAGRWLFGQQVGLWGALLIAVFPFQVYYAQEVRMYTLLGLLTAFSLLLFLQAIERNRWQTWGVYWLCLTLGIYTHYFMVFVILAYHFYLLLYWRKYRHLCQTVIMTDGMLLLAFLPQAAIFIRESEVVLGSSYWLGKPNPLAFFTTIYFFIVSYTVPRQLNAIGLFVTLSWLAIGLYEIFLQARRDRNLFRRLNLLNLGAFLPLFSVLAISRIKPIFLERTLIVCTPFLVLLLARMLSESHLRSPVPYLAGALSVFVAISLYHLYFDSTVHKPPMRQAAERINTAFTTGDMVLHTSVGSFLPFLFYQPPVEHYLLWGDPNPRKPATTYELFGGKIATPGTLVGHCRLWLVVMLDHSVEYQQDQVNWFDDHFPLVEDSNVDGIFIRLYDGAEKSAVSGE